MSTRLRVAALLAGAGALVVGAPGFSSATFTSSSSAQAVVAAAADWTPPAVVLQSPAPTVSGIVTLAATATDQETGITRVEIQYLTSGGTWTTLCADPTAPYTCDWDTRLGSDGTYSLRARATDGAGQTSTSPVVTTTVVNTVLVQLGSPGDVVRGTVPLTTTVTSAAPAAYTVRIEYAPAGTSTWKTICTSSAAPYTCDWSTTAFANQDYDLRAVATTGSTTHVSAVVTEVLVDNAAPSVSVQDPGSPLRGTVTVRATATDPDSGVARVTLQYAATGSSTFTDLCTVTTSPYACSLDTTRLADGTYGFRAVAVDQAGNQTTSPVVVNRVIDNTVSSVSVTDPGHYLTGRLVVAASANSTAGVASVRIQRSPSGAGAWTDLCTDAVAPWSCDWDTTSVPDGLYDLRAVLVDGAGRTTVSAVVAGRRVDNAPLRAADIQTTSGGAIVGRPDAGDQIAFTYSTRVSLATVTAGWDGTATSVTVRIRDGLALGLGSRDDTVDVLRGGASVNLGSLNLQEDYVRKSRTAQFAATMTASEVILGGVAATRVTITLGAQTSGQGVRTVSAASAMVWSPSALVTDLAGRAASAAPLTEVGPADREF